MTQAAPRAGGIRRRLGQLLGAGAGLPIDPDLEPTDPGEPAPGHRPALAPVRRSHPAVILAIAAGGCLGALARYELQLAWPVPAGRFPVSTFVINSSGAFGLGLLLSTALARMDSPVWRYLRLFGCVGVLGAWTTMSTVAVESDTLVRGGSAALAAAYLAATMVAGVAAAAAGTATGRRGRRGRPGGPAAPVDDPGGVP
ncbi:MAG TPA: CrcB family protein [Acidimicrobiales bacterium]|jgi:CrcB protein